MLPCFICTFKLNMNLPSKLDQSPKFICLLISKSSCLQSRFIKLNHTAGFKINKWRNITHFLGHKEAWQDLWNVMSWLILWKIFSRAKYEEFYTLNMFFCVNSLHEKYFLLCWLGIIIFTQTATITEQNMTLSFYKPRSIFSELLHC